MIEYAVAGQSKASDFFKFSGHLLFYIQQIQFILGLLVSLYLALMYFWNNGGKSKDNHIKGCLLCVMPMLSFGLLLESILTYIFFNSILNLSGTDKLIERFERMEDLS